MSLRPSTARGTGRPSTTASIAASCSGDIQPGVPPSRSATHSPARIGLRREVEVEEHRLAVDRDQHVRRLDVHVDQAARVGVVEGVGQAGGDPGHRLDVGRLFEAAPERPVRPRQGRGRARVPVDELDEELPGPLRPGARRPGPRRPGPGSCRPGRACRARGGPARGRSARRRAGRCACAAAGPAPGARPGRPG